jgi:hypothetical protein
MLLPFFVPVSIIIQPCSCSDFNNILGRSHELFGFGAFLIPVKGNGVDWIDVLNALLLYSVKR